MNEICYTNSTVEFIIHSFKTGSFNKIHVLPDYSERLEDLLDHHLIDNEKLVKRKRLGGVGYLLNGNMCLGIFEQYLVARVGKNLADILKSRQGFQPYAPGNPSLEDFVMIESAIYNHSKALERFIDQAISFTATMPPKNQES